MAGGRASFEIQTCRDGRWSTEDIRETESAARAAAKTVFGKSSAEGVRVLKCWERADGLVTENVIMTEMRKQEEMRVTIVPIDQAPVCRQPQEYYRLESRVTINRLFRKYIEKVYLTPTELMHNYRALKKVQEVDTLFPAAVDRVSSLQGKALGEDPRNRRDEIYQSVAAMTQKARKADENPNLPKLKNDLDEVLRRVENLAPPGEADYYALVVLSRDLVEHRNWLGKLERLVALAAPDQRSEVLGLLDGVIADVVGVPTALQDILGHQRNLAQALCAIADLYEGRFAAAKSDAREQIDVLNPMLAKGRLEETKRTLMERLLYQLAGGQPLSRHDPAHEREAFREIALRLFRPEGFLGGAEAAEALTRRYVLLGEEGGLPALRAAVDGMCGTFEDPLFRTVYLCQLAASKLGETLGEQIIAQLYAVARVPSMAALAPAKWPPRDKMLLVTRLYQTVAAATALDEQVREEVCGGFDDVLAHYIQVERIIEKLDEADAPLRRRATHLVEFCASGVLPTAGKAQAMARQRAISVLRQPNFDQHFLEGITNPQDRENALRDFHALLSRAGFKG